MLAGVAGWLVREGWLVVLPSRRYSPLPADELDSSGNPPGRALWVEARWERPRRLARDAERALGGKADLLVSWVHDGYRVPVMEAVAPLLADDASIVEVRGQALSDPAPPEPMSAGHPVQRVVLGYVMDRGTARWLSHTEIVDGVLTAVRRALEHRPMAQHQVGEVRPWPPAH